MPDSGVLATASEFSLVRGGLLYRFFVWSGLCDERLDPPYRRTLLITLAAWLPLLILSLIDGRALPGSVDIPFLYDIEIQVRILVALPLLLVAESAVERILSPRIKTFILRDIV